MAINYENTKIHWNYFLAIEQDFELSSRYIEFSKANNDTFSIELARIIMASSQEVDVLLKLICESLGYNNLDNIKKYWPVVNKELPNFLNEKVFIPRFGMDGIPWTDWSKNEVPIWWTANNRIKHQRTNHFEKANLKNAFNAVGALLITNLYYYKTEFEKEVDYEMPWKSITIKLHSVNPFIRLKDEYYHEIVVV
jgi:hypothetical protein